MFCKKCQYNLKGSTSHACPECGAAFAPDDSATYLAELPPRYNALEAIAFSMVSAYWLCFAFMVAGPLTALSKPLESLEFAVYFLGAPALLFEHRGHHEVAMVIGCLVYFWWLAMICFTRAGRWPIWLHAAIGVGWFVVGILGIMSHFGD